MELKIKINLIDDEGKSVIGPGIVQLLELIKEKKSINKAAKKMGLSYVKALKLLKNMEDKIGKHLLIKKKGGNDRGGTDLTPDGVKYLMEFEKIQNEIKNYSNIQFGQFLKKVNDEF
jgi:molybdate transport system regulatory protein